MSALIIAKSTLRGILEVPSSKSQTQRALILASLAKGQSHLSNLLLSSDTLRLIDCLEALGAWIHLTGSEAKIEGITGKICGASKALDVGNSGIALRFLTALAAHSPTPITLTGDAALCTHRPMKALCEALRDQGAQITYLKSKERAPLTVVGPVSKQNVQVDGAESQPVSALLMAALFSQQPTTITVTFPGEVLWVDLTLSWLDKLGVPYIRNDYSRYEVHGRGTYEGFEYSVPGDWSSAAFPIAAALVTGSPLTLENIDLDDLQPDKMLLEILKRMGAKFSFNKEEKTLHIPANQKLFGATIDINACIDTITALSVIACFAEGETRLMNASIAREKECDRISCTAAELQKMGASIAAFSDGLVIRGTPLHGSSVCSHGDHRLAMALAVAGLGAIGTTTLDDAACIDKTYPHFVEDMKNLGAQWEKSFYAGCLAVEKQS